jgi:Mg2+ and Co2+ transporter CorA
MMQRKVLTLSLILMLLIVFIVSNSFVITIHSSKIPASNTQESHLIKGVSYVAQNERNFCVYACLTMIFNNMGLNTSLNEMLFYSGVGYTHSYNLAKRLPNEEIYRRFDFLYSVYGVSSQSWWPQDNTLSKDELWEQYFTRLKENITKDIPVITMVNPFSLPSLRNQFKVNDDLWKTIFPTGKHVILVIGYNETNRTICYNDPNAGFYGDNHFGDHAWINISTFRQIQEKINNYHFNIYIPSSQPLTKNDAFEQAFRKNIENLTGGIQPDKRYYGISASKQMQNDFSSGENKSQQTYQMYKEYGGNGVNISLFICMHTFCSIINPRHPNVFDILLAGKQSPFADIAAIKSNVADYLQNCSIQPSLCKNQSDLLRNESARWHELSNYYNIFLRKGIFLSDVRAIQVMNNMDKLVREIIDIEEALIAQS